MNKQVDYDAFASINQSSLVFDGRLVIDEHNRTNDSIIYAGGPLTKFKRGYHRDESTHACFSSKEVGNRVRLISSSSFHHCSCFQLADELFAQYDPIYVPPKTPSGQHPLIPTYEKPLRVYAVLPGLILATDHTDREIRRSRKSPLSSSISKWTSRSI